MSLICKSPIFERHLQRFIYESNDLLINKEKHYRMKFVMDMVESLLTSMDDYIIQSNSYYQDREKLLTKEREKINSKIVRLKKNEDEL